VGPNLVITPPPSLNRLPGFSQAQEPVLVQAFVSHLAVEALDERILDGLSRLDEAQLHASFVGPQVLDLAAELRLIVPSSLIETLLG
jgi:hypothetical protein